MIITVLKIGGAILFLFVFQYVLHALHFIFGRLLDPYLEYYWFFVSAGLVPAFIAKAKGDAFWGWWLFGTVFPIFSIFFALELEDRSHYSSKPSNESEQIEQNDQDPKESENAKSELKNGL